MKKLLAILLATLLLLSLAACTANGNGSNDTTEPDSTAPETTEPETEDSIDPLELLTTVWNTFPEAERFAAVGGDIGSENTKEDEPGVFSVADISEVDRNLGYPSAQGDCLEAAASLVHMLNSNTFTAGAYQIKSGTDMDALAKDLAENIQSRQWICGFPDRLLVAYVGNCLIGVFGADDLVQTFETQLSAAYSNVVIVSTDPIA